MKRILKAFTYSYSGFKFCIKEPAFYQELILTFIAVIVLCFVPFSIGCKILIILAHLFTMLIEMINTAIEAVVDLASPEIHPLAKKAKDIGSLTVLTAFIFVIVAWGYPIYHYITN